MKTTNFVLVNMMNTLQNYSERKLPQKISYAITRNMMIISKECEVYDTQLKKIFEEYSEHMVKDENEELKLSESNLPIVDEDVKDEYNEQITDLLNIEVDIDMYYINSELFNYDDKGIYDAMSAHDIMILQSILCEPENDGE